MIERDACGGRRSLNREGKLCLIPVAIRQIIHQNISGIPNLKDVVLCAIAFPDEDRSVSH